MAETLGKEVPQLEAVAPQKGEAPQAKDEATVNAVGKSEGFLSPLTEKVHEAIQAKSEENFCPRSTATEKPILMSEVAPPAVANSENTHGTSDAHTQSIDKQAENNDAVSKEVTPATQTTDKKAENNDAVSKEEPAKPASDHAKDTSSSPLSSAQPSAVLSTVTPRPPEGSATTASLSPRPSLVKQHSQRPQHRPKMHSIGGRSDTHSVDSKQTAQSSQGAATASSPATTSSTTTMPPSLVRRNSAIPFGTTPRFVDHVPETAAVPLVNLSEVPITAPPAHQPVFSQTPRFVNTVPLTAAAEIASADAKAATEAHVPAAAFGSEKRFKEEISVTANASMNPPVLARRNSALPFSAVPRFVEALTDAAAVPLLSPAIPDAHHTPVASFGKEERFKSQQTSVPDGATAPMLAPSLMRRNSAIPFSTVPRFKDAEATTANAPMMAPASLLRRNSAIPFGTDTRFKDAPPTSANAPLYSALDSPRIVSSAVPHSAVPFSTTPRFKHVESLTAKANFYAGPSPQSPRGDVTGFSPNAPTAVFSQSARFVDKAPITSNAAFTTADAGKNIVLSRKLSTAVPFGNASRFRDESDQNKPSPGPCLGSDAPSVSTSNAHVCKFSTTPRFGTGSIVRRSSAITTGNDANTTASSSSSSRKNSSTKDGLPSVRGAVPRSKSLTRASVQAQPQPPTSSQQGKSGEEQDKSTSRTRTKSVTKNTNTETTATSTTNTTPPATNTPAATTITTTATPSSVANSRARTGSIIAGTASVTKRVPVPPANKPRTTAGGGKRGSVFDSYS